MPSTLQGVGSNQNLRGASQTRTTLIFQQNPKKSTLSSLKFRKLFHQIVSDFRTRAAFLRLSDFARLSDNSSNVFKTNVWSIGRITLKQTYHCVTLSTRNLTWTDPGSKPGVSISQLAVHLNNTLKSFVPTSH